MSIRNSYSKQGVDSYYQTNAHIYSNPHKSIVHDHLHWLITNSYVQGTVLDLCTGDGLVKRYLEQFEFDVVTSDCYFPSDLSLSFADIADGQLTDRFDTVICSFALHLCKPSLLATVLYQLSCSTKRLITVSPTKRLMCDSYCWTCVEQFQKDRVYSSVYVNNL